MPIYEFKCVKCSHSFEELCAMGGSCEKCPNCGSNQVLKQMSAFSARSAGGEGTKTLGSGSCSSCHGGHCHNCH
ncbi:MAG TPA: FmdB family zinc ribbon protein [Bacillota bacterium]|nr:FmdB family zinc ribbon protein [Bacillota bacterium]